MNRQLTARQQTVLDAMRTRCRENMYRQKGGSEYLYASDIERVRGGDKSAVFGLGVLTWGLAHTLGMKAPQVLATFKALEKRGLVIREDDHPSYKRPLYWWPVGLAAELVTEIDAQEPRP